MNRNSKLIDYLDSKFAKRYEYDKEIAVRIIELGMKEDDENTGGGRSNIPGRPTETMAIAQASDPYIQNRIRWKKAIDDTLKEQSKEVEELMRLKYWGVESHLDWRTFGEVHHYSGRTIYRLRQKILFEFGRKIGEI